MLMTIMALIVSTVQVTYSALGSNYSYCKSLHVHVTFQSYLNMQNMTHFKVYLSLFCLTQKTNYRRPDVLQYMWSPNDYCQNSESFLSHKKSAICFHIKTFRNVTTFLKWWNWHRGNGDIWLVHEKLYWNS